MNCKIVAKDLQEPLQQTFEVECRSYANYLEIYKMLFRKCEELEAQRDVLKERIAINQKISDLRDFFDNDNSVQICKVLDISSSDLEKLIRKISRYTSNNNTSVSAELQDVEYEISVIGWLLKEAKEYILATRSTLFKIINYVYDAGVELKFSKRNSIVEKVFILYYEDRSKFDSRRKVIQVKDCKLRRDFMKAYQAKTESEIEEAYQWFVNEAKKYKI